MSAEETDFSRPVSLADVADRSTTLTEFGHNLQEWLHSLRGLTTRDRVVRAIRDEPVPLSERFPDGDVADAWLAAYAELVASRSGTTAPEWAFAPERVCSNPWFAEVDPTPSVRRVALVNSPLPFKRRNIYTASVDLPLRIRPGRPTLSLEHKRKRNAERQRRFRARRAAELERLRRIVSGK